tara:strand:+ start:1347 stop:1967 length:621 start_codon:yes stop_codon:yes gene_type:complete
MRIDLKKTSKPIKYSDAIDYLEKRVINLNNGSSNELIWMLEHPQTYTGGTSYKKTEILDKSIRVIETSRGGKITCHGPGQLICYFVIDLKKRNRDIRKFINNIENSIIESLFSFGIKSKSDRKNIGIWTDIDGNKKKVGAIGIKVKKWIAFHGFSLNIENDLKMYKKIIPCGIKNCGITNLIEIKKQNYKDLPNVLFDKLTNYLKT